jgi:two-component system, OmpR family, response regulator VanR
LLNFNAFFAKVICVKDAASAYALYEEEKPDIILADIEPSTFKLIRKIRDNDQTTPIILLSQDKNPENLMLASNASIDGYVVKPIKIDKILTLICSALKRNGYKNGVSTLLKDIMFNHSTKELYKNGKQIVLGTKELQLLLLLAGNTDKTFSKREIEDHIYPLQEISDSALKNLINSLRHKLGKEIFTSVRGMGWRIRQEL